MPRLKYYNQTTGQWEYAVVGAQGPSGIIVSDTAPESTNGLWLDSDEEAEVPVPEGGTTGQVLAKSSNDDYDTEWTDVYTTTETDTAISTAISNLVDSAPSTLDTLNELSAALNDDENFSTTVTTALGEKAPIDSPTFTGTVAGPKLRLTSNSDYDIFTDEHPFQVGPTTSDNLVIDKNDIQTRLGTDFAGLLPTLYINRYGGQVEIGNSLYDITLDGSRVLLGSDVIGAPQEPNTNANTAKNLGYVGMPQVILNTGNLTLSKAHAGKHIYVTGASQTITIPANSSVPFEIGTTVVIVNANVTSSIAITGDTLRLVGTNTTGTRTLVAYGMATLLKIDATTWIASGNGLA
jgi:hypothetical protein